MTGGLGVSERINYSVVRYFLIIIQSIILFNGCNCNGEAVKSTSKDTLPDGDLYYYDTNVYDTYGDDIGVYVDDSASDIIDISETIDGDIIDILSVDDSVYNHSDTEYDVYDIGYTSMDISLGKVAKKEDIINTDGITIWSFDAAYDKKSGKLLLVMAFNDKMLGLFINRDCVAINSSPFTIVTGSVFFPRVASNGEGQFILTYTIGLQDNTFEREYRLVDADSGSISQSYRLDVSTDFNLAFKSAAVWNNIKGYYIISWSNLSTSGEGNGRVATYLSTISSNGDILQNKIMVADAIRCGGTEKWEKHNLPEIALSNIDGSGIVVGFMDMTSDECKDYGGLWYRGLNTESLPYGDVGIVNGKYESDLLREQRVVYIEPAREYIVVYVKSPSIWAQRISDSIERVGEPYIIRPPILDDMDKSNDKFGQPGVAYDSSSNIIEIMVRGHDDPPGPAPVFRFRLGGDGLPFSMEPDRVEEASVDPSPIVISIGSSEFIGVYRMNYSILKCVLISN